ncbi:PglY protein [Streptomyces sp. NPDC006195]|uniref:PglY protein n=1 Tax=unclassified Streptomyces TaxID=2593676 RepID=UPI0033BDEFD4
MGSSSSTGSDEQLYLRDVLHMPESVLAGKFKVELSDGFDQATERVNEYVVTDQLELALRRALKVVQDSVQGGDSNAAYLHGSYGSGKSHFMTVLHAILSGNPAARAKPRLQPVIVEHDVWLRDRKFLMVPYHLVGSTDLDSALLGGYVTAVTRLHPDAPVPPVYRVDAMFADARRQRDFTGDDAEFIRWLGNPDLPRERTGNVRSAVTDDEDDLEDLDAAEAPSVWTSDLLDRAFTAASGDKHRDWLASALLSGPFASYSQGALGAKDAFVPLENGLDIISRHAKALGYDGLILFIDELILWLQAHLNEQSFVNSEIDKLVKLIESGVSGRPLPVVSFISRQRDLAELIGANAVGADVKNLESRVNYLSGRIDTITVEDKNLPEIIKERVLKPKDAAARAALDAAFARLETSNQSVRDVLLDANGITHADWADFKALYPVSPVLLNVLVALSSALQRERTGLKLLQQVLNRRRADMKVGQLVPLGDLWDVLVDGMGEAFTDRLRSDADAAIRFYGRVQAHLEQKYKSADSKPADSEKYKADDRFIKTMLLAYLAPEVPALTRLTGPRLAALNHGSIRSRTGQTDSLAITRMRELQAAFPGELRSDGNEADPVFTLHLSDLDVEPILDSVGEKDSTGARKRWVQEWLWRELRVPDEGELVSEREIVWHGTRRTAEFVFEDVSEKNVLPDGQFEPGSPDRIRFVLGYPGNPDAKITADEIRVFRLQRENPDAATVVWLPSFLSSQRGKQLGRLLKINYLLDRDHLRDFATHLSSDDQVRVRHQLEAQRDTLNGELSRVLHQAYGLAKANEADFSSEVTDGKHVHALFAGHTPQLQGGGSFEYNLLKLADGLFDAKYPKHPNFDRGESRKPITTAKFKMVYGWIAKAMDAGGRVVVDGKEIADVARVVHALELGEVHDGPLTIGVDWMREINRQADHHGAKGDYSVEDIRVWIAELGWTGLDTIVSNLVIATYALLSDRSWVLNGKPEPTAPALDQIGSGWALRAQELPSKEEFAAAHTKAALLLVTDVPALPYARNVNALATAVREKAAEHENDIIGLRHSLAKHRAALGVSGEALTAREQAVRDAADLLARIKQNHDATGLARDLAAAAYATTDLVLGKTVSSAKAVLEALDNTDWEIIESVRKYIDRGDGLADRAERLLAQIAEAASKDEYDTPLAHVLKLARSKAVELINEAARLSTVAPPVPPQPPAPTQQGAAQPSAEPDEFPQSTPGTTGPKAPSQPSAPSSPAAPQARRVVVAGDSTLETALGSALADVREQIQSYAAAHPGAKIEINWQVVQPDHESRHASAGHEDD